MSLLEYNIMKARHGRYADTSENRRLHRVGQEYGHAAKEDPEAAKKSGKGEEAKEEKRTFDTARKELSAVLSHKDEFIQKYGEDEYNKRVGALVVEAQKLRGIDNSAAADKDFDKMKQPEKPKDTRSKKEKRSERLAKYKEQLKKVQEKMNQEGESEESRKMGEALEAKWKAKIEKLEAKVNRGQKKEKASPSEQNKKEFEAKLDQALKDGKISQEDYDSYKKNLGDAFKKEKEAVEAGKSSQDFWDEMNADLDEKMKKEPEQTSTEKSEIDPNMSMKKLDAAVDKELDDVLSAEGVHNDSPEWRKGAYDVYKRYKEVFPNKKAFKNGGNFDSRYSGVHHDAAQGFKMHAYIDARDKGLSHEQAEKEAQEAWANWQTDWHYTNDLLHAVRPDWGGEEGWDTDWRDKKVSKEFDVDGQKVNVDISVKYKPGQGTYYEVSHNASGPLAEKLNNINSKNPDYAHDVMRQVNDAISGKED